MYIPTIALAIALLNGTWYNELGSTAIFDLDKNGTLSGSYKSAVGNAEDFYVLTGRYETAPRAGVGLTLGWTVNYRNHLRDAHSTATWSGQFFGEEGVIKTQWLLTSATSPENAWASTNIGSNVFTRSVQRIASEHDTAPEQFLVQN